MSPVDKEVVKRKLAVIVRNLEALEPISEITGREYGKDLYRRKGPFHLHQATVSQKPAETYCKKTLTRVTGKLL